MTAPEADPNYLALRALVDVHAERAATAHDLACQVGCTACCRQDLHVTVVEADAIFAWLREPASADGVPRVHALSPPDGARTQVDDHELFDDLAAGDACAFLGAGGLCSIYDVRPIICRSHGLPLSVEGAVDVCPLSLPLSQPPVVLDLEGLNLRLSLIAQLYETGEGLGARDGRVPLSAVRAAALSGAERPWYL